MSDEADCFAVAGWGVERLADACSVGDGHAGHYDRVVSGTARYEVCKPAVLVGGEQEVVAFLTEQVVPSATAAERVVPWPSEEKVDAALTPDVVVTGGAE